MSNPNDVIDEAVQAATPTIEDLIHALANDVQTLLIRAGIARHNETHPVADATAPANNVPVQTPTNS